VTPDIMASAKGIGGGLPLGARPAAEPLLSPRDAAAAGYADLERAVAVGLDPGDDHS